MPPDGRDVALDDIARDVGVQQVPAMHQKMSRSGGLVSARSDMKSSGTPAASASAKRLVQDSGRRHRMTSPVDATRRIKTSVPSSRNSFGRRTAMRLPLRNSFAVRGILASWYIREYITTWGPYPTRPKRRNPPG